MSYSTAVITIASANYLPYVKTLMQSVQVTNPDYRRYLILADKKPLVEISCGDLYEVIEASSLGIECFDDMVLRYDVMEFNTAIKPFAIDWLFENTDITNVIYLDPDIHVYRKLHELDDALKGGASAVVTPHITQPIEDGKSPSDYNMLQAGVFNLGFIAFSRKKEAIDFVKWWSRRLKTQCHADFSRNLFTDQRWVDLAPCYLAELYVLRSPAYNVAYWNLVQRPVSINNRSFYFGGSELAFFHFSGLDRERAGVVSKHQDRFSWSDIKPIHALFLSYRKKLMKNGWLQDASDSYFYNMAGNLYIAPLIRRLYRELYPDKAVNAVFTRTFVENFCNRPANLGYGHGPQFTMLMQQAYRERSDLQGAFDLKTTQSVEAFCQWFAVSAAREYGIDTPLLKPDSSQIQESLRSNIPAPSVKVPNAGKSWLFRKWRKIRKWYIERQKHNDHRIFE